MKRLWIVGGALALFMLTLAVGNSFAPAEKRLTTRSAGHDFLAFYTAGTFVRQGWTDRLYDLTAVKAFQRDLVAREKLELAVGFGPFWNPPVFAWVFVPLAGLPYTTAWWVWFGVNLGCAAGAMTLLCLIVKNGNMGETPMLRKFWGLVPLLMVSSLPFVAALGHGQNTCVSLLLLGAVVWFWRKGNGIVAGLICGLLFYKPQLGALVAGMLALTLGWRAALGVAISGTSLVATMVATLPGLLGDYLHKLPGILRYMQVEHRYMWERHATLKAFWRLLVQGYAVGEANWITNSLWLTSTGALAAGLAWAVVCNWRQHEAARDRLIAATITTMPLLMPFYFDYDLLLLAIAAALSARVRLFERTEPSQLDRWLFRSWIGLFCWMFVNAFVTGQTHVNGTVLILSAVAAMTIAKAQQPMQSQATGEVDRTLTWPVAA